MRKVIVTAIAVIGAILLSGCAIQGPGGAPKKVEKKIPLGDKSSIIAYVDNTMDQVKQEKMVDTAVWAVNKAGNFRVAVAPGYIGKTTLMIDTSTEQGRLNALWSRGSYFASFGFGTKVETFNQMYDQGTWADEVGMNENGIFSSATYYQDRHYRAIKLDNKSFEITGFKTKREAVEIFFQIDKLTSDNATFNSDDWYKRVKAKTIHKYGFNDFLSASTGCYVGGFGYKYDGEKLEKENRLIITPRILEYSIKEMLEKRLEENGIKLTQNPKEANTIFVVQNLHLSLLKNLHSAYLSLKSRIKNGNIKIPTPEHVIANDFTQTGVNFMQSGHSTLGAAGLALGALALLDTRGYDFLSKIDLVSVFYKGENIYTDLRLVKYRPSPKFRGCARGIAVQYMDNLAAKGLIQNITFNTSK
jgi:hypothetical protein